MVTGELMVNDETMSDWKAGLGRMSNDRKGQFTAEDGESDRIRYA